MHIAALRRKRGLSNIDVLFMAVCAAVVGLIAWEMSPAPATDVLAVATIAESSPIASEQLKLALAEEPVPSRGALRTLSKRIDEEVVLHVARQKTGNESLSRHNWLAVATAAADQRFEQLQHNKRLIEWTEEDMQFAIRHKPWLVLAFFAGWLAVPFLLLFLMMKLRERSRSRAGALALVAMVAGAIASEEASAAKHMDIRDGDTVIAVISARDQTRIRVEQGRILDVIGEIYDAKNNPGGRLTLVKDDAAGEVYVKFIPQGMALAGAAPGTPQMSTVGDSATATPGAAGAAVSAAFGGPLKLDVKTDRGTVGLLLQPAGVVGDTLVLQISGGQYSKGESDRTRGKSTAHIRSIKALTLAMAAPEHAADLPVRRTAGDGEEISLWREARFVLRARYDSGDAVGESYQLTNVSEHRMVIDERELFRPGVLSVSVRQMTLQPGESTPVWIVRAASAR